MSARRRAFIFTDPQETFTSVRKDDIKGCDQLLAAQSVHIELLKKYPDVDPHVHLLPGVLFLGRPGAGKTYTACYYMTATGARAINVRRFPGVYERKGTWTSGDVRELFDLARGYVRETGRPIILFWDEFDSVGKKRTPGIRTEQTEVMLRVEGRCSVS